MEKAIVYFTRDGSTALAAGYLAEKTGAKAIALKPQRKLRNFMQSGFLSVRGKTVALDGDPWRETAEAQTIILAAPVWAGNGNPVMNSFIKKADFTGKRIYLLTVQADLGKNAIEKVMPRLSEAVEAKGGTVSGTLAIHGCSPGKSADQDHINKQLKDWTID